MIKKWKRERKKKKWKKDYQDHHLDIFFVFRRQVDVPWPVFLFDLVVHHFVFKSRSSGELVVISDDGAISIDVLDVLGDGAWQAKVLSDQVLDDAVVAVVVSEEVVNLAMISSVGSDDGSGSTITSKVLPGDWLEGAAVSVVVPREDTDHAMRSSDISVEQGGLQVVLVKFSWAKDEDIVVDEHSSLESWVGDGGIRHDGACLWCGGKKERMNELG